MSATRPVGINSTIATSGTSVTTTAFQQQSDTLRIVAETAGVHVTYGANPVATTTDYYVSTTDTTEISLGPVSSQRVVGITTGATTIIDFPEGTGSPFDVGDTVTLTVTGQPNFDFEHKTVQSVNNTSGVGGYFNTRIVVDHDSSSVTDVFSSPDATLRKSFKVAVITDSGTGKAFIQQVQVS